MTVQPLAAEVAGVVSEVMEGVFGTVTRVRDRLLARHEDARRRGDVLHEADVVGLGGALLELLTEEPAAVGLGVIVAPGLLPERPLLLEWWQSGSDLPVPTRLEVDLSADSLNFYDYVAAEWFEVPRRTGRRHVVGPYVDVHGTDRYLLTLTEPVLAGGQFLGVAGADVPVARFETLVLRGLADLPVDVVVISDEGRVVLSTSPRRLIGELVSDDVTDPSAPAAERLELAGLPWQVQVHPHGDPAR